MNCAWQEYLSILPHRLRSEVDCYGKDTLLETRLRLYQKPMLITTKGIIMLETSVTHQDLQYTVNTASEYSPWSASTIAEGFITASGGHRIGICGSAIMTNDKMSGIRSIRSLAIRVARDISGIADALVSINGSILILGSPGTGKTTLLRDLIYQMSQSGNQFISVVDERQELFPFVKDRPVFDLGKNTDVLSGCPKKYGISFVLRNMCPSIIAVDEITQPDDCEALLEAAWCGTKIIATAHAGNIQEFHQRLVYRSLIENKIFQYLVVMRPDKSWSIERIQQ